MKTKYISILVSLLLTSFTITSCLGDSEPIEYSPDPTLKAFGIDTIFGVTYKFTIDQVQGKVYNEDSLPVGSDTIIDRILITTMASQSNVFTIRTKKDDADSIFTMADSVDLSKTMEKPFLFKSWAPDLIHAKEYKLEVRVHQVEPDTLMWGKIPLSTNYAPEFTGKRKMVYLNGTLFLFGEGCANTVYSTSDTPLSTPVMWSKQVAQLPADFYYHSITAYNQKLYLNTTSGDVYTSTDGLAWNKVTFTNAVKVKQLIAVFPMTDVTENRNEINGLAAIANIDGKQKFCMTDATVSSWTISEDVVPADFPMYQPSHTTYSSKTGVLNALLVGNTPSGLANDTTTIAWGSTDGLSWKKLSTESYKYKCPKLTDPTIFYYGNELFLFGKGFATFYHSPTGLTWKSIDKKFMLPQGIRNITTNYTMALTPSHFIWLALETPNEVWRGRWNELSFDRR